MKYGIKEYLEEYSKALEQKPEGAIKQPSKPNIIDLIRSKKNLGNKGWPLV